MGGLLDGTSSGAAIQHLLTSSAGGYRWVAAAVGSNNAAGYQLASGEPVMAIGGFNGTDPSPTLAQFQAYVADGRSTSSSPAVAARRRRGGGASTSSEIARGSSDTSPPRRSTA